MSVEAGGIFLGIVGICFGAVVVYFAFKFEAKKLYMRSKDQEGIKEELKLITSALKKLNESIDKLKKDKK